MCVQGALWRGGGNALAWLLDRSRIVLPTRHSSFGAVRCARWRDGWEMRAHLVSLRTACLSSYPAVSTEGVSACCPVCFRPYLYLSRRPLCLFDERLRGLRACGCV